MIDPDDDDSVVERDERLAAQVVEATTVVCHGCLRPVTMGSGPDDACIPTLVVCLSRCQKAKEREWEKEPGMRKRYDGTVLSPEGARDMRRSR